MKPLAENADCRVLQVTEATAGGVLQHLRRVVPALIEAGLPVDLLLGTRRARHDLPAVLEHFRSLGCRTATFGGHTDLACMIRGTRALRHCQTRWQVHLVHLHAARAGIFGRLSPAGAAVVYSPHGLAPPGWRRSPKHWLQLHLERLLAARTAGFICVSQAEADQAGRQFRWPETKITVIENGLEPNVAEELLPAERVRREWDLPAGAVILGFPARLAPQKDPAALLQALARRPRGENAVHAVFCGDGPLRRSLQRQARNLAVDSCVTWMGYVDDLPRRLRAFDITVLPSRYEGLSYALLESLASGIPVIAADLPANLPRSYFAEAVLTFQAGNSQALAEAIEQTIRNLPAKKQAAEAVAERVKREFRATEQGAKLARYYRCLTGRGSVQPVPDMQARRRTR